MSVELNVTFGEPKERYNQEEESQFRLEVFAALQELGRQVPRPDVSGSPGTLAAGDTNNYDIGKRMTILRLTPHASNSALTGIVATRGEKKITVFNVAASATLTLKHQNTGSSEENRIITHDGNDLVLAPDESAQLVYDFVTLRWRVSSASGGSTRTATQDITLGSGSNDDVAVNDDTLVIRLTTNAGGSTLTGFTGGEAGRVLYVQVVSAPANLTLSHDSTSTAANRIMTPTAGNSEIYGVFMGFLLAYDAANTRWLLIGKPEQT
jgi:hypothetical protein